MYLKEKKKKSREGKRGRQDYGRNASTKIVMKERSKSDGVAAGRVFRFPLRTPKLVPSAGNLAHPQSLNLNLSGIPERAARQKRVGLRAAAIRGASMR